MDEEVDLSSPADFSRPAVSLPPQKPALRAAMLARLRALPADERRERSARLVASLVERADWQRARVVGLFAPLHSEPDLDLLWNLPGALAGKTVVYPRVEEEAGEAPGGLVLRVVNGLDELVVPAGAGRRHLREPPREARALAGADAWPDLLLVPGLAFTAAGGRLGRGGGHYDRLLARPGRAGCRVLGAGFAFQLLPGLPREDHDADLDGVVTDSSRGV